ncbi:unnamed protein product [Lepeophtheirus salmonis]|uniref:(salmon louse) hypothetical protein n=1 Tax=Lepeophtheirus salmonis TaxID=72036 RepID=A0A7R8CRS3_LEPSM|nr:unnamed protein product [Lepeophtheirus salmonis]CAF2910037.1 unnamed protein product [Lepeophtheirus salmonis]
MDSKLTNQSLNYSTLQTLILSSNRKVQILEERTLKLECIILNHPKDQSPGGILWQLNGSPLDFRWHRGGLHLKIIRNTRSTEASLTLIRTRTTDSGTYSCHSIQAQNSTLKVTFDELKVEILPLSKDYSYSSSSSSYCFKYICEDLRHVSKTGFPSCWKT